MDQTGGQQAMHMPEHGNTAIAAATYGIFRHPLRVGKGADFYVLPPRAMGCKHAYARGP